MFKLTQIHFSDPTSNKTFFLVSVNKYKFRLMKNIGEVAVLRYFVLQKKDSSKSNLQSEI